MGNDANYRRLFQLRQSTVFEDEIGVLEFALVVREKERVARKKGIQKMVNHAVPDLDMPGDAGLAGVEADYFSVSGGVLEQTIITSCAGTDSGRYRLTRLDIGRETTRFEIGWRPDTLSTVGGRPWQLPQAASPPSVAVHSGAATEPPVRVAPWQ